MLRGFKLLFTSLLLVLCCVSSRGESVTDTLVIYFRQNSSDYDPSYMKNGERMEKAIKNIKELQQYPDFKVTKMDCYSSASPEGSVILNEYLSRQRGRTAVELLSKSFNIPDSLYFHSSIPEDWESLTEVLKNDTTFIHKDTVLHIINTHSDLTARENAIKKYDAKVWNTLTARYFRNLRAFRVHIYMTYTIPVPVSEEVLPVIEVEEAPEDSVAVEIPVVSIKEKTNKHVTLKTNFIGWAAMGANLAVEIDLIPHLSLSLPVHYSGGVEYSETVKFRCAVFQPELRYYPWLNKGRNQGFFLGLHAGAALYNFAFDGEYRYQDKDGRRPAYGGGLGLGYSFRFGKNTGWGMEIAVGGGVYDAEYDIFYNEANGPYYKRGVRKLWYGVDNASLSLFYKFDIKKKREVR